jgi:hypothetical protein
MEMLWPWKGPFFTSTVLTGIVLDSASSSPCRGPEWALPWGLPAQQNRHLTLHTSAMRKNVACCLEKMISTYKTTRHQNPEIHNPYNRRRVNLRTYANKDGDSASWDLNWQETIPEVSFRGGGQKYCTYDWNSAKDSYSGPISHQRAYRVI